MDVPLESKRAIGEEMKNMWNSQDVESGGVKALENDKAKG